ncbi:MAG: hypothetical protein WDM80_19030 [Limisphaerales bacterium]
MNCWNHIRDFLSNHSDELEIIGLIGSILPAWFNTKRLWTESRHEIGWVKRWHITEIFLLWALPFIFFFSTKATDWTSEKTLNSVKIQSSNDLAVAKIQIVGLSNQVQQLEAVKPTPLKARLIECLEAISPQIIPSLKGGYTHFAGNATQFRYNQLELLSAETSANLYIKFNPDEGAFRFEAGIAGVAKHIDIVLKPALLEP